MRQFMHLIALYNIELRNQNKNALSLIKIHIFSTFEKESRE